MTLLPTTPAVAGTEYVQAHPRPAAQSVARLGGGWLARAITAGGGHLESFGFADPSSTAYAVVGLQAAGVGRNASRSAVAYLKTELTDALEASDGSDDPGRLGFYILAAVSTGENPRRFGGRDARNDLVARLLATARTTGPDAGLFGAAGPTFDGAFRQGVALAALRGAGVPSWNRTVASAIRWLSRQQCANGLWQAYRADVATPCPAADPSTFSGPDTNSTGMAVQGLAAYGRHPRAWAVLASLDAIQSADGGFPYLAVAGQDSDPNSTALTIQALLAEGARPAAPRWRTPGGNPFAALASYQLGCADAPADRGAFFFPGDRSPNVLATVQAVPAAARRTLPVRRSWASSEVPVASCRPPAPVSFAAAGTAGPCPGDTGVTVAVDFKAFGGWTTIRCAPDAPANGVAALQHAGFTPSGTAQYGLAFICRIDGKPTAAQQDCRKTPPATAYWANYHANKGATTWTYATTGAMSYKPQQGSIEAWAFGASAKPSKTPDQVRAS